MKEELDPYYDAMACSEQGFPTRPHGTTIHYSSDLALTHDRWVGPYRGYAVEIPTGTTSGILAIIVKLSTGLMPADALAVTPHRLVEYGIRPSTTYFYDEKSVTFLYECHNEVIVDGSFTIDEDIRVLGNGGNLVLPFRIRPAGFCLSRDMLSKIDNRSMGAIVHQMNIRDELQYHLRDAA